MEGLEFLPIMFIFFFVFLMSYILIVLGDIILVWLIELKNYLTKDNNIIK